MNSTLNHFPLWSECQVAGRGADADHRGQLCEQGIDLFEFFTTAFFRLFHKLIFKIVGFFLNICYFTSLLSRVNSI
jgi:hypothetical protein